MEIGVVHDDCLVFSGNGNEFTVDIKPVKNRVGSFYEEATTSAHILYEKSNNDLHLMFGGGNDGEYMVNVFREAEIPFKVAIISYGKDFKYNIHDTRYALNWCNKYNYDPVIIDIDLEDLIRSGKLYDNAEESKCCSYQMCSLMEGLIKVDGTLVMASEPQLIKTEDGTWCWEEMERINSYSNWFESRQIPGTSDFGSYTGEQVLAFLEEPIIKKLVNNEFSHRSSIPIKRTLYNQNSWTQDKRSKYTGWELFERTDLFTELNVLANMRYFTERYNGSFYLEYDETVKRLRGIA